MNDPRPTESEVTIGRLRKRIIQLMDQRDSYKNELTHYKIVVGGDWRIEHRYKAYTNWLEERKRIRSMEARIIEQEELIKKLLENKQ